MRFKKIVNMFENGNVSVSGMRGTGKDLLFSNVIARRKNLEYVSNINYGYRFNQFRIEDFDTKNNYHNFITGKVKRYKFPYPDRTDLYLSDCGITFPSQEFKDLNKEFDGLVTFSALSRHLGLCNVHTNSQYLGRVWDKLREQSNLYIVCQWSRVFFGKIVIQRVRIYEKYESALNNCAPFRCKIPFGLFGSKDRKTNVEIAKTNYLNSNGKIESRMLIYLNKGTYDSRAFRKILKGENISYEI